MKTFQINPFVTVTIDAANGKASMDNEVWTSNAGIDTDTVESEDNAFQLAAEMTRNFIEQMAEIEQNGGEYPFQDDEQHETAKLLITSIIMACQQHKIEKLEK